MMLLGSWLSIMHGSAYLVDESRWLQNTAKLITEIERGDRDNVRKLLKTVQVVWKDKNGWTPLLAAAEFGRNDILTDLIDMASEQGVASEDFVNQTGPYDVTALMVAAKNGHLAVVKQLLENGAKMFLREDDGTIFGKTALMFAAENGHQGIEELLLEKGANPKERDSYGNDYLMLKNLMKKRLAQEEQEEE